MPKKTRSRDPLICRLLSLILPRETIDGNGRCPYLQRWRLLRTKTLAVYIHRFIASDWSRDLHDHPRRFISIGLKGGYWERIPVQTAIDAAAPGAASRWNLPFESGRGQTMAGTVRRYHRAPWLRTFGPTHIHRVEIDPGAMCWTLVIALRSTRPWGFWPEGRWVPSTEYRTSTRADLAQDC